MGKWWTREATDKEVCVAHGIYIALALFQALDAAAHHMFVWVLGFGGLAWCLWNSTGYTLLARLLAFPIGLLNANAERWYTARAEQWWCRVDRGFRHMRIAFRMGAQRLKMSFRIPRPRHWSPRLWRPGHRSSRTKRGRGGSKEGSSPDGPDGPPHVSPPPHKHPSDLPLYEEELPDFLLSTQPLESPHNPHLLRSAPLSVSLLHRHLARCRGRRAIYTSHSHIWAHRGAGSDIHTGPHHKARPRNQEKYPS